MNKERNLIRRYIASILDENYAAANKYLNDVITIKVKRRCDEAMTFVEAKNKPSKNVDHKNHKNDKNDSEDCPENENKNTRKKSKNWSNK